ECVCADAAEAKIMDDQLILKSIGSILKNPKDLVKSVEQLQQEYAAVKKKLESAEQKMVKQLAQDLIASAQNHMGVLCVGEIVELDNLELLKKLAQDIRTEKENLLVIVAASISGKSAVAVGISDALVKEKGLDANAIIKNHIAPMIQGGGGGQKGLATAGGQRIDELAQVVTLYSKLI
ncbi:MAG: alanine--tRNA ligase, partial [Bacteroidota bacterium]